MLNMTFTQAHHLMDRQWRMLLVYNIYRFISIFGLFYLFYINTHRLNNDLFYAFCFLAYLIFGLCFLYFWYVGTIKFEQQVLWSGTVDIVAMVLLIHAIGYVKSGFALLLYVTIALLSILTPGRLAIYFSSIASSMLLLVSFVHYETGTQHDLTLFFTTGVYGAGFFATAITAWYLASWVRSSELLVEQRDNELLSMLIEQQAQQFKLESLGRLSASLAHELRNPLGIISHAAQLMGENTPLDEEGLRLKELIIKNSSRMNRVIETVLQLSRRKHSDPELIELCAFLKIFTEEFSLINVCDIKVKCPKDKKITVFFDKNQLNQILVILCDNSMQHGKNAKGKVHITLSVEYIGREVVLNVSDKGSGIPYSERDMVFEPFFTTLVTGTGMGLYIAKDLVEMNGARLQLNQVEQGCSFSILFNDNAEI